jgi:CelD/BcsL family acetyltransferase involved in cellulose biosynthesis
MYESRIAADHLEVVAAEGFPAAIDTLADDNIAGHGFLRAAWYGAGGQPGRTLVVQRGAARTPIAAIPTVRFGPAITGVRKVAGGYWPLRSPLFAPDCSMFELAQALDHPAARSLGPVWRVGPARQDDPGMALLIEAARLAGWTVLSRPAGTSWAIDCDAARAAGWPRASTARKLRAAWRKLEELGTPRWRYVRGAGWNDAVLADLGQIEAQSWVGRSTNGKGAKFLTPDQRAAWSRVLSDPRLAENLVATILMLDDRPVAFSFDLDDAPVKYGIAGSFVTDLRRHAIGKLANYRAFEDAIADGHSILDMGAGDNGYKRAMGAAEAYRLTDLLFVRSRPAARVLARGWGALLEPADRPGGAPRRPAHG